MEIYPEQNFPDIWSNINKFIADELVWLPPEVVSEIHKENDAKTWVDAVRPRLWAPSEEQIQAVENEVASLVKEYPRLRSRSGADYYVVAWAKLLNETAVCQESQDAENRIPSVCRMEGVKCVSLTGLIRAENWRFVNAP